MLKALATGKRSGRTVKILYLGVDAKNIELLMDAKPLRVPLGDEKLHEIVIFYGRNQADALERLRDSGVKLPPDVEQHDIDEDQEKG